MDNNKHQQAPPTASIIIIPDISSSRPSGPTTQWGQYQYFLCVFWLKFQTIFFPATAPYIALHKAGQRTNRPHHHQSVIWWTLRCRRPAEQARHQHQTNDDLLKICLRFLAAAARRHLSDCRHAAPILRPAQTGYAEDTNLSNLSRFNQTFFRILRKTKVNEVCQKTSCHLNKTSELKIVAHL